MKLRIKGNSIRLRLLRSEVDRFALQRSISDEVHFGPNSLRYSLRMSSDSESIRSSFEDNEISVFIPEPAANAWANGDGVGLEAEQPIGNGEMLSILIEKDFVCVGRPDDPDREDAFPV